MNSANRILSLKQKHAEIEKNIAEETASPGGDDLKLNDMKRQKLTIRDEIKRLEMAES